MRAVDVRAAAKIVEVRGCASTAGARLASHRTHKYTHLATQIARSIATSPNMGADPIFSPVRAILLHVCYMQHTRAVVNCAGATRSAATGGAERTVRRVEAPDCAHMAGKRVVAKNVEMVRIAAVCVCV